MEPDHEINNRSEVHSPQKPNDPKIVSGGNQEGNNNIEKPPQLKSRFSKEQKGMNSPYQDLMKNLFAINAHYSKHQ